MGHLAGGLRDFCLAHKIKAPKFGEIFGAFFVRKFVAQKKSLVQNSCCRRATLIVRFRKIFAHTRPGKGFLNHMGSQYLSPNVKNL